MTFAEFQSTAAALDRTATAASNALNETAEALAAELNIPARGAMGLTPDAIKFHPRYRTAKAAVDSAFAAVRQFNGRYAGTFKREIRAAIDARRRARLQS